MQRNSLFALPDDLIDRNIIPFANYSFTELVDEYGNIKGANILKKTLDFEELKEEEFSGVKSILHSILIPKETLMAQMSDLSKNIASTPAIRTIFITHLISCLQAHYDIMAETADMQTMDAIKWIPSWCNEKAKTLRNTLLNIQPLSSSSYMKTRRLTTIISLCAVTGLLLCSDRKDNKIYIAAGLALLAIILNLLSNTLNAHIEHHFETKNARNFHTHLYGNRALAMLDKVIEKKVIDKTSIDEEKHRFIKIVCNPKFS